MSPDLEKILQSRYPSLYQELRGDPRTTGMSFGFEVGDGWFELINAASAIIAERGAEIGLEPVASQIKEKFGTLRCHFNGLDNDEYLRGMLRMASSLSTRICENCGSNGSLKGEGFGWFRVQCDECERNYRDGGTKKYKKANRPQAKLSSTDLTSLLHGVIAHDVKFNDLEEISIMLEGTDDEGVVYVDSSDAGMRVAGMLALLERFSSIKVRSKGEKQ